MSGTQTATATAASAADRVVVTLTLAGQLCGIPVRHVRDVLRGQSVTRVPLAPAEVAGVLNLRGRIVTAIDLRRRLGLPPAPEGEPGMSVVVEREGELYSLQVDRVSEVVALTQATFEEKPPTLDGAWRDQAMGVHRLETGLLVELDPERLIALDPRRA
jgi:purine-binding chemotaxis protein CheW